MFLFFLVSIQSKCTNKIVQLIPYEIPFPTMCHTGNGAIWKLSGGGYGGKGADGRNSNPT